MKITQLMLSKGFGGAERYFVDLSLSLAEAGHQVQAVCHRNFVAHERLAGQPGIELATVNALGMWDRWSLRRLRQLVSAFGPQVLHAHLARGAWAGGHVATRCRIPLVVKTHNYVKLKYYRHVDVIIPTTRDQERYLLDHGIGEHRISRIPNFSCVPPASGVGTANAAPIRFVSYGRMVRKKGFDTLLGAFGRLRRDGLDCRLVIGGDGPELEEVRRQAADLGAGADLELPGWVDDVSALLARGDVFVLPSLAEPFGIAVLEAMAAGKAIVTTRTAGPSEIVDESCAWLVEIGDVESLSAAMRAAANNAAERRRRGEAALERYKTHYYKDAVVPRIVALYEGLAARAAAR